MRPPSRGDERRCSAPGSPAVRPAAGITMRRIGSPGGASSGGTTRSAGIATGWPAASKNSESGENIRIGSMRWPSSVAW